MVTVIANANSGDFPFDGLTVAEAREKLADIYNISADAVPTVNGAQVAEGDVLRANSELVFSPLLAQKG